MLNLQKGILQSHKNKETTIIQNNMEEYHNVKQRKADLKEYLLYSFSYIKYKGRVKVRGWDYPQWGEGHDKKNA